MLATKEYFKNISNPGPKAGNKFAKGGSSRLWWRLSWLIYRLFTPAGNREMGINERQAALFWLISMNGLANQFPFIVNFFQHPEFKGIVPGSVSRC